jgi:hypothetical protein
MTEGQMAEAIDRGVIPLQANLPAGTHFVLVVYNAETKSVHVWVPEALAATAEGTDILTRRRIEALLADGIKAACAEMPIVTGRNLQ